LRRLGHLAAVRWMTGLRLSGTASTVLLGELSSKNSTNLVSITNPVAVITIGVGCTPLDGKYATVYVFTASFFVRQPWAAT
jgi:hypothetical protein